MSLFQFDYVELLPSEQIGQHSQATWEIVLVLKGSGVRNIDNVSKAIQPGELILIPPHTNHCWHFKGDSPIANVAITFPPSTLTALAGLAEELDVQLGKLDRLNCPVEYFGEVKRLATETIMEMHRISGANRIPHFFNLLLLLSNTSAAEKEEQNAPRSKSERHFEQFRIYCKCNCFTTIRLADVAAHLGMNKTALCTFIKRKTGMTFTKYINEMRMEKLEEIITEKIGNGERISIAEAAYLAGFQTIPYFNTCFRQRHGCSPSAYIAALRSTISG